MESELCVSKKVRNGKLNNVSCVDKWIVMSNSSTDLKTESEPEVIVKQNLQQGNK